MGKYRYYQYFVEGECEEKVIKTLKSDMQLIVPGKVQKFNVVQNKLTEQRLMQLKPGTAVVLVFDTDTLNSKILEENIEILQKEQSVKAVLCITQVKNLEDEFVRSCDIKQIRDLTGSKTNEEFKHDMQKVNNFDVKLTQHKFDFNKFWAMEAGGVFSGIKNSAGSIKK